MSDILSLYTSEYVRIVAIVLAGLLFVQLFYILFFYLRFVLYRDKGEDTEEPPVSVIITARDEAHNLERFLESVLTQDYPHYEVIVVDHASTDETKFLLKRISEKYNHLYVTSIPYSSESNHSKKLALIIGIKAAKNDVMLFTDADCEPASKEWIRKMVRHFDPDTHIVLGYGAYKPRKGLLDKWIRLDTAFIAMQYFGFALSGLPYMGVGRNMAWRKSFFNSTDGFDKHIYEPSGSDDLFVNHNANKRNTKIEISPESFTYSLQPEKWKYWFVQKDRHMGAAKFYKFKYKVLLTLEPLTRILFFATAIYLALIHPLWQVPAIAFAIREFFMFLIWAFGLRKLKEKRIFVWAFVYDKLQPVVNVLVYLFTSNKRKAWK